MDDEFKTLIKRNNWLFKCQRKFGNFYSASLNSISQDVTTAMNSSEVKQHELLALKLNDPKTAPKTLLENTKNIC